MPAAALIVVDVQSGTISNARAVSADDVVERVRGLVHAFRAAGLMLVHTISTGTPAGRSDVQPAGGGREFPIEAQQLLVEPGKDELVASRRGWSAFSGTELAEALRTASVSTVVIAGMATSYGVESTARDAYDLGFHVIVVKDAISDPDPEVHADRLARVFPLISRTVEAATIIESPLAVLGA
jgi:nicotinamidase-related amidase